MKVKKILNKILSDILSVNFVLIKNVFVIKRIENI